MASTDDSCGEDSDDVSIMQTTQTEREILAQIKSKFGSLPRQTFISDMCSEFTMNTMSEFRSSLYNLAVDIVPETPVGRLMIRKDTQNSGGKSASAKTADDVFILYQFLEGDKSMDISKLLTERSRRELNGKNKLPVPQNSSNVEASDKGMDTKSMQTFFRDVMIEMRKDRDIINDSLININRQLGCLPCLEKDIRELRSDMNIMKERVVKVETQSSNWLKSQSDNHSIFNHVNAIELQVTQYRAVMDQNVSQLRSMLASNINRINNMELTMSQYGKKMNVPGVTPAYTGNVRSTRNIPQQSPPGPRPVALSVQHDGTVPPPGYNIDPDQTYAKTVIDSPPNTRNRASSLASLTSVQNKSLDNYMMQCHNTG
jgi:hypothetical protein